MQEEIDNNKGFTLIELTIVIVIVAILAAVAIPKFLDATYKAKASEFCTVLTSIYSAQQALCAETGSFTSDLENLQNSGGLYIPTSQLFDYFVEGTESTFTGTAISIRDFGEVLKDDAATIDNTGTKKITVGTGLKTYCPNWN